MPIQHNIKTAIKRMVREQRCFINFICSCLDIQTPPIVQNRLLISNNGIPSIIDEPCQILVKCSNNEKEIRFTTNNIAKTKLKYKTLVIICLLDVFKTEYQLNNNIRVIILGSKYVKQIATKHPDKWWYFVTSCSDINLVEYDESIKRIIVKEPPSIASKINFNIRLKASAINELSAKHEKEFIEEIEKNKNPAIFVGNGVSIHFGSDLWVSLSDTLFDYLYPKYVENQKDVKKAIGNSTFSNTSMSKFMINPEKFEEALYSSIFRKYEESMHTSNSLIRSISTIKSKYIDLPIITYNYDNFLEIDFKIYNNGTKELIPVYNRQAYKKTPEPKVSHVHGYIPYNKKEKKSPKIVLTQEEYYSFYKGKTWTVDIQKEMLRKNTCLFVGSSMSDLFQMSIINDVRTKENSTHLLNSWHCFALMCLEQLSKRDIVAVYNYFLNKGIHIIFVDKFEDLSSKLLSLIK